MSTHIKYLNYFDQEITVQQASQLDLYTEQTYENGRLKKVKHFDDNELIYIDIYIYSDEDMISILNALETNIEFTIAKDLEEINGYKAWKHFHYKNGVLSDKYKMGVLDSEGREIAFRYFNADGTIRKKGYKKYYVGGNVLYDDDGEVDLGYADSDYIIFEFLDDGLKVEATFDHDVETLDQLLEGWQNLLPFMTPDKVAYFTNLEPLIPDIDLYS